MLGAILVAGGLMLLTALVVFLSPVPADSAPDPSLSMTVIPAPTLTPTSPRVAATPTATQAPSIGGISVGSYVQITGTDGEGLRLRSGPGTDHPPRLLGMDAELFLVKDGPQQANEFIWWFLEAPYDPERSGWAAAPYLTVVDAPQNP
jgi:hypothetical protein